MKNKSADEIYELIHKNRILPVVALENEKSAVKVADALLKGGLGIIELTLRTDTAMESMKLIHQYCPEMVIGAGTVMTVEQCRQVIEIGAEFIVSPGFDEGVVDYCIKHHIPVMPGCATPTEVSRAMGKGLQIIKFFPAELIGGVKALRAFAGPFPKVCFIPTGGINENNLREYLEQPNVYAVGGSWMCTEKDVFSGDFDLIAEKCKRAAEICQ